MFSELILDFDTVQGQGVNTPTPTGIAILTVCSGILIALIGAWGQVRKSRLSQQKIEHEVTPPKTDDHTSLREELRRIADNVAVLDDKLDKNIERLVRVETIVIDGRYNRRRQSDR